MATSYKEISGPVTVLTTFTVKPEDVDKVAQNIANIFADQMRLAREGKLPGLVSLDVVRFGCSFASWEKYTDAEAVERIIMIRYKFFKEFSVLDGFSETPNVLYYSSDVLPLPQNQ